MATKRYDMPASFGPSTMPPMTTVEHAIAVIISFETDSEAIAPLLPRQLSAAEPAVVSVASIAYPSTDYMGGRGYNEIVVTLSAVHEGPDGSVSAGFAPVLWVDQFGALFSGREFQGLPKLLAEVSSPQATDGGYRIGCSEYGTPLVRGEVSNLQPLSEDKLEAVRKNGAAVPTFGWKHIPSAAGEPDADYVTINYTRWAYDRAWTGDGTIEFLPASHKDAPFGGRVAAALAGLPIRRWKRAFVGEGTVIIDRTMTRKL